MGAINQMQGYPWLSWRRSQNNPGVSWRRSQNNSTRVQVHPTDGWLMVSLFQSRFPSCKSAKIMTDGPVPRVRINALRRRVGPAPPSGGDAGRVQWKSPDVDSTATPKTR